MQQETPQAGFDRWYQRIDVYPPPARSVLVTDGVSLRAEEVAQKVGLVIQDFRKRKPAEVLAALEENRASAILGRGGLDRAFAKFSGDVHEQLMWRMRDSGILNVVRLGNGVDHIPAQELFDHGIVVERTPHGNAGAVRIWQDLLLRVMVGGSEPGSPMEIRKCNPAAIDNREIKINSYTAKYNWDRRDHEHLLTADQELGNYFKGKKVAVIGIGRIGQEVIDQSPFLREAKVVIYDSHGPTVQDVAKRFSQVETADTKEEALRNADLVLLHVNGEDCVIGKDEIALLANGAMICNVARGKNIDPEALYKGLESRKISAAGLDTHFIEDDEELRRFSKFPASQAQWEPEHFAVALRRHPRVAATNHSAASEAVAQEQNAEDALRQVDRYNRFGEVFDGIIGPVETSFPYAGFVQKNSSGYSIPAEFNGRTRIALEIMHDGMDEDLLQRAKVRLDDRLGGRMNHVAGDLFPREFKKGDRIIRNSIALRAYDLPHGIENESDRAKLFRELCSAAEAERGVHRARIFRPVRAE